MFKLAGEAVHNSFPTDIYCTHQKVLQEEVVYTSLLVKNEKDIHVVSKTVFLVFSMATLPR